jgi:serine/threonine protein phosphatase PrpC
MDHSPRAPRAQKLRWSGRTDRGRVRQNNEDAFLGQQFDAREMYHLGATGEAPTGPHDFVFAVSDGMGGARAGEFASRITIDKVARLLPRSFAHSAQGLEIGFDDVLAELFDQVHQALVFVGGSYEETSGMQATLSMCWFTPGWMFFGHIGDSRIYYLPAAGGIKQISHDDTYVGWLFRTGQINEREARAHPRSAPLPTRRATCSCSAPTAWSRGCSTSRFSRSCAPPPPAPRRATRPGNWSISRLKNRAATTPRRWWWKWCRRAPTDSSTKQSRRGLISGR